MLDDIITKDNYLIIPYRCKIIRSYSSIIENSCLFYTQLETIFIFNEEVSDNIQKSFKLINFLKSLEYNIYIGSNLNEKFLLGTSKKDCDGFDKNTQCEEIQNIIADTRFHHIYLDIGIMNICKLKLLYM